MSDQPIRIATCPVCHDQFAVAEGHNCDGWESVTGRPEPRQKGGS